ncbi:MAG: GIY-YIG nuclease family protein [Candidatus Doudnabacteria bacterium]|nr:GIY-YIG nuclease family protein [Candidatus Doudnabacteria bacterium]
MYALCLCNKSINYNYIYIGQTADLRLRFSQHNADKEIATKAYCPFKVVYYEAYASKKDALVREKKLKQFGSHGDILKDGLQIVFNTVQRAERKVRTPIFVSLLRAYNLTGSG